MDRVAERFRSFFPASGQRYRLFDSAWMLVGISLLWYILSPPTEITIVAIGDTVLSVIGAQVYAYIMLAVGIFSLGSLLHLRFSKKKRYYLLDAGYGLVMLASGLWAITLFIGTTASLVFNQLDWETATKAWGSSLWFAYLCSNTAAALMRERKGTVCSNCGVLS